MQGLSLVITATNCAMVHLISRFHSGRSHLLLTPIRITTTLRDIDADQSTAVVNHCILQGLLESLLHLHELCLFNGARRLGL